MFQAALVERNRRFCYAEFRKGGGSMKLNEKIVWYRRQKKLSQEELAAQVGVSRQAVSKWELGVSQS